MTLPIRWQVPDGLQSQYASQVLVQAGQFEIVLTFFEAQLPILLGQPDENKAKLEELGVVQARAVARIILPPQQAAALLPALQTALETFAAMHPESAPEDAQDSTQ